MPTGYTQPLYEGKEITFKEFVMRCARAFGALITMRDEPLDAPIPEIFEPSDYHFKKLEEAKARLALIESWDKEEAEKEAEKAYKKAIRCWKEDIARKNTICQRYEDMLAKVRKWVPPTPDHRELKNFTIQQLEGSIEFDCDYVSDEPVKLSGTEYKSQQIAEAQRDINYHNKELKEEIERTRKRNRWLKALRESLESPL